LVNYWKRGQIQDSGIGIGIGIGSVSAIVLIWNNNTKYKTTSLGIAANYSTVLNVIQLPLNAQFWERLQAIYRGGRR
jgi:hypothetical protein